MEKMKAPSTPKMAPLAPTAAPDFMWIELASDAMMPVAK